jgi:arginine utilization protein RocB
LSRIVSESEFSEDLADAAGGEAAPPPTWLYLRDRKGGYSVSTPLDASGCISILTLNSDPGQVIKKLIEISRKAFRGLINDMNESFKKFCSASGREYKSLPWQANICTFEELLDEAGKCDNLFTEQYKEKVNHLSGKICECGISFIEASFALTEFVFEYISDLSPRVVIGLVPPYYPNTSNLILEGKQNICPQLSEALFDFADKEFKQKYEREYYFTGISDLSYFSLHKSADIEETLRKNMPFYGSAYSIPLAEIEALSMPCINIGPWGKDFHKLTERVYKQDLYERTPGLLAKAIEVILEI